MNNSDFPEKNPHSLGCEVVTLKEIRYKGKLWGRKSSKGFSVFRLNTYFLQVDLKPVTTLDDLIQSCVCPFIVWRIDCVLKGYVTKVQCGGKIRRKIKPREKNSYRERSTGLK